MSSVSRSTGIDANPENFRIYGRFRIRASAANLSETNRTPFVRNRMVIDRMASMASMAEPFASVLNQALV